mmetsp:Transcript_12487/g.32297  ORF Transcript_12487/g.32297 Transcript_12487/m.32297 type:complete len:235 (+) Transcript_12487:416-1120(+)
MCDLPTPTRPSRTCAASRLQPCPSSRRRTCRTPSGAWRGCGPAATWSTPGGGPVAPPQFSSWPTASSPSSRAAWSTCLRSACPTPFGLQRGCSFGAEPWRPSCVSACMTWARRASSGSSRRRAWRTPCGPSRSCTPAVSATARRPSPRPRQEESTTPAPALVSASPSRWMPEVVCTSSSPRSSPCLLGRVRRSLASGLLRSASVARSEAEGPEVVGHMRSTSSCSHWHRRPAAA